MAFDPRRITSRYFSSESDSNEEKDSIGLSIDKLLQAFRESSDLYQAPLESHGLRHDLFRQWIERHPSERLQYWASQIYEHARYVSHKEFFSKYDLIAEELLYQIESSPVKITVYLYLGMTQIRKSNFWILLYLLSRMHRVVDHVITVDDLSSLRVHSNSLLVIPDDAIYSGKQMFSQLDRLYRKLPVSQRLQIVIASAFISVRGRELIQSRGENIHFPVYSESFDVTALPADLYVHQSHSEPLHTIYFDHKLADMYSVYQTIYALGVGLSDEADLFPYYPVSLIANCDPPELIHEKYGEGYSMEETVEYFLTDIFNGVDIQDAIEICPFSPYKKRKYTLEGQEIESLEAFH
jgi:hypothetical protein